MRAAYGQVIEVKKLRTQGTTRLLVELPAEFHKQVTEIFDEAKVLVTLAPENLSGPFGVLEPGEEAAPAAEDYGDYAKALKLNGFFRNPHVLRHVGTDADYQSWCRSQKCAFCRSPGALIPETGEMRCEYAHVRQVSAGSGTSLKPDYSGLPACHSCHEAQHQGGYVSLIDSAWDSVWRVPAGWDIEKARRAALKHLEDWAWAKLKADLGYASWKEVPPTVLCDWARPRELMVHLPRIYKEAAA